MAIIGQITLDQLAILEVDADPTTTATAAAIGSIACLYDTVNGKMWIKSGAGDTAWSIMMRQASGTAFTAGAIPYADASGYLVGNTTQIYWDATNSRLSLGANAPAAPQSTIHIDRGNALGGHIRFTAGTTTGVTSGDGTSIGIDNTGAAEIRQYENSNINFYTNNTFRGAWAPNGQLLIGGTTPIDITGTSVFPFLQIIGTTAVQMVGAQYSADTIGPVFNLLKSRGVSVGTQGLVSADDEFGRIQFRGSDGVNFQAGASIRGLVDGAASAGSMPGRLIFMTTPTAATTPVERMRIDSTGLVIFSQGIRLGNEASTVAGNIRYSGTDTESYVGGLYKSLTGAWIGYNVESVSAITNTSATDVLVTGMTVTPAAGSYIVNFCLEAGATSNNRVVTASIYVNGVQVANSSRQGLVRTGNATFTQSDILRLTGSTKITVNGTDTVDMRWRTNGGTASAQGRNLTLTEVGS